MQLFIARPYQNSPELGLREPRAGYAVGVRGFELPRRRNRRDAVAFTGGDADFVVPVPVRAITLIAPHFAYPDQLR